MKRMITLDSSTVDTATIEHYEKMLGCNIDYCYQNEDGKAVLVFHEKEPQKDITKWMK